jgi:two-component system phosphate regulon sensor histidine kinase PhoR
VPALVQEVLNEARGLSRDGRHQFSAEVDPKLWIKGSSKELHSAFSNLVSNAVRYSPEGGNIELRWQSGVDGAQFSVKDHGIGIESLHIERLTERFYRVNKDRSRGSGGTGLGLAIVKHVLQRHDARLHIDSEPGKGSTFTCEFPATRIVLAPVRVTANG